MHHFKVFLFHALVSWLWGMWDLSSPTKDRTCIPCIGSEVLTTGPPGKSQRLWLLITFSSLRSQLHSVNYIRLQKSFKVLVENSRGDWKCSINTSVWGHCKLFSLSFFFSSFNSFPATMLVWWWCWCLVIGRSGKWFPADALSALAFFLYLLVFSVFLLRTPNLLDNPDQDMSFQDLPYFAWGVMVSFVSLTGLRDA